MKLYAFMRYGLMVILYCTVGITFCCNAGSSDSIQAISFHQSGRRFALVGDFDKAKQNFLKAIQANPSFAPSYNNLGVLYRLQGNFKEALRYFNSAESIYYNNYEQNYTKLAGTYNNKGILFKDKGDYFQALKYYNNALNLLLDSQEDHKSIGQVYNNIGIIYYSQGQLQNALEVFEKSIEIKKKYQPEQLAVAYSNCALVYQVMGELDMAERFILLSIDNKINYYGKNYYKLAEPYLNYGRLKILQGDHKQGLEYFEKARNIYILNYGEINSFLATVYLQEGNYYLEQGIYDVALERYQNALISAIEGFRDSLIYSNPVINDLTPEVRTLNILRQKAKALFLYYQNTTGSNKDLMECLNMYDLIISLIEKMRGGYLNEESKLFLTKNAKGSFNNAIDITFHTYNKTKDPALKSLAFIYAEKSKAALLSSALSDVENKKNYGIPMELQREERNIQTETDFYKKRIYQERQKNNADSSKIIRWRGKMFGLSQQYDSLLAYLNNNFPEYYKLKYDHKVVETNEIQEQLGQGSSFVEYALTDSAIYIYVITDHQFEVIKKEIDTTFYSKLDFLIYFLKNNQFGNTTYEEYTAFLRIAHEFYNLLLEQACQVIGDRKITIVPDEKLGYLPFEALLTELPDTNVMDFRDLPYLIRRNCINYSYSATLLYHQKSVELQKENSLVAFAPTYENINQIDTIKFIASRDYLDYLVPLKYLKEEVLGISEITDGDVFIDYDATEKAFWNNAANYDILHFAMHTLINDERPMFSQLVFTLTNDTSENNDGLLNTYEIYNMDLNARMAVLSACNTGYGKLQKGEGIMSLARGFIYAGVPSIVMTLWAVEDRSGSDLMKKFYEYVSQGYDIDKALQKAKLQHLESSDRLNAHPYLWSAYVSIGKTAPLFTRTYKWYIISGVLLGLLVILILAIRYQKRKS